MTRSPLRPVVGWPAEFAERYRAAGYWTDETFDAFLAERVRRFADRIAVVGVGAAHPRERVALSYAELDAAVGQLAGLLAAAGVERRDRVVLQLPNCVEYVVAVFAAFRLGALPVFALPAHREREIGQFARISDAAAYVFAGKGWGFDYAALAERVAADLQANGHQPPAAVDLSSWNLTGPGPYPSIVTAPAVEATDIAFLQMSGGTTGVPKLVPRTHADYLYSVRASADICDLDETTVMLVALPAAHNFPMSSPGLLGVLDRGGTVVLAPDPSPRTCFGMIESERVTLTSLVPPLAQSWLASAARGLRHDLSSLEVVQVGGARLADSVARRIAPELGCSLQQVYGMAEGLVCYTRADDPDELVTTSQGRPISSDDELRIDPETGELATRGPYTIRGYYGADEVHVDHFTDDGFYRTGDVVRQLPSGHLQVTGRIKDQINRGGDKIAIDEVEDLLLQYDGIHDAAIVSVPDAYLGERVCAYVVPKAPSSESGPGATDREPTLAEIRAFLTAAGLAPYKQPDELRTVAAFPATAPGKVNRRRLRASLAASVPATQ